MSQVTRQGVASLLLLSMLAGMLAACGGPTPAPEEAPPPLAATSWQLVKLKGADLLPGTILTAVFGEGSLLAGWTGCNVYSATYVTEGSSISITSLVPTAYACGEAEKVQETGFLALLQNSARYDIEGDQLTLATTDGQTVGEFSASPPRPLEGTQWELHMYNDQQSAALNPLPGPTLTALFDGQGNLSGSAGCNQYSTTYELDGDSLTLTGPMAVTAMACSEPQGIMEQESTYLSLLELVAGYDILAVFLSLNSADGQTLLLYIPSDE